MVGRVRGGSCPVVGLVHGGSGTFCPWWVVSVVGRVILEIVRNVV